MPVLFTLETNRARLIWRGPVAALDPPSPGLVVESVREAVWVQMGEGEGQRAESGWEAPLRLTEETTYTIEVQSRTGAAVTLQHRDPVLTAGLATLDAGRLLHGALSFG